MRIVFYIVFTLLLLSCERGVDVLMKNVKLGPSEGCDIVARCGELAAINCGAEVDGPFYYVNEKKSTLVMCCGGCCDGMVRGGTTCAECPPAQWTCD